MNALLGGSSKVSGSVRQRRPCSLPNRISLAFIRSKLFGGALKALLTRIAGDSPQTHLNSELVKALRACGMPLPELESSEALEGEQ